MDCLVVLLKWKNLDVMAYVRGETKILDASRFGSLLGHARASMVLYAGRSGSMLYGAWHLRQKK